MKSRSQQQIAELFGVEADLPPRFIISPTELVALIPTSGFYEWAKAGTKKKPHHFHMNDDSLFAFAGLWECWHSDAGEPIESCSIITTEANDLVKPFHIGMPVTLPK